MFCNDCGNKVESWQEHCARCGADLFKKQKDEPSNPNKTNNKHSIVAKLFGRNN